MPTFSEVETELRPDPNNPLNLYRKQVDIDFEFFQRIFFHLDPFDQQEAYRGFMQYKKFLKIVDDHPEVFVFNSDAECGRTDQRVLAHNQLVFYLKEVTKTDPLSDILGDFNKMLRLAYVMTLFREESLVKFTVSLQLAYRTIDNLGTEQHEVWKHRLETF